MAAVLNRLRVTRFYPLLVAVAAAFALAAATFSLPASAYAEASPQADDANSWRYLNGERIVQGSGDAAGSSSGELSAHGATPLSGYLKWTLTFDGYTNGAGDVVSGAIARGVDVSEWNRTVDWDAVRNDGIGYAVIRVGYGNDYSSQDDEYWERNVAECERLGIPFGVYIYSYAKNAEMAQSEAEHVLRLIGGHKLSYPVYFDMEDKSQLDATGGDAAALAEIARTFCDAITNAGYDVGIYANKNWFDNYLTDPVFDTWTRWVAQYNVRCDYQGSYDMWQYTSTGRVAGIDYPQDDGGGVADVNYLYTGLLGDVDPNDWYVNSGALCYVFARGYMGNYSGTNYFGPYDTLDRGMVATILWRMAGEPAASGGEPFDDVASGTYYCDAVRWAKETGVVSGYRNADGSYTKFGPYDPVTREQMATMFARYASICDGIDTASDGSSLAGKIGADEVSDWARPSLAWAVDSGLIEGVNGCELRPQESAWRASMAQVVRTYSRIYLDSL